MSSRVVQELGSVVRSRLYLHCLLRICGSNSGRAVGLLISKQRGDRAVTNAVDRADFGGRDREPGVSPLP